MPFKCCVPNCNGNYRNGPKVSVFGFPTDEEQRGAWIRAICREKTFIPNNNSKVCELHFHESDIERDVKMYDDKTGKLLTAPLTYPRLHSGAVPSKVMDCPAYLSRPETSVRESPADKKRRIEMGNLEKSITASLQTFEAYNSSHVFNSLDELKLFPLDFNSEWTVVIKSSSICFTLIKEEPHPQIVCSVKVDEMLSVFVHYKSAVVTKLNNKLLPTKVHNINDLQNIVNECHTSFGDESGNVHYANNLIALALDIFSTLEGILLDKSEALSFLKEQVSLLNIRRSCARYSAEFLVFCSLLQSISPHAYHFLRAANYVKLPSDSTVKSLNSNISTSPQFEQGSSSLLKYIKEKFSLLGDSDKTVILLIDEIHVKSSMDYKGGSIVGAAIGSQEKSTTACVFMVYSLLSSYKDVVHILPVQKLNGELLHKFLSQLIIGLEDIGFEVLGVISDNNSVNRKAMSLFADPPELKYAYVHPQNSDRPLFYLFDSVHLLKCIRNNWLNNSDQELLFPAFDDETTEISLRASFACLKQMHAAEKHSLIKYGYGLTLKALYPSSLERQSVKLVLSVFNSKISTALRELGPQKQLSNWADTATFIEMICKWWDVVNVQNPLKGLRKRNVFQQPITTDDGHQIHFLSKFSKWLETWHTTRSAGQLTSQTYVALSHTTRGLVEIAKYLLNKKQFNYVLLGKFQTDKLEERFGQYRQLSGGNYHVSVRQIFESEKKLRLQSVLPLVLKNKTGEINISLRSLELSSFVIPDSDADNISLPSFIESLDVDEEDIEELDEAKWPILTYIAGYCSHGVLRKVNVCDYCKVFLLKDAVGSNDSLIFAADRGGLKYPSEDITTCVAYSYVIVQKLFENFENDFLQLSNQKNVLVCLLEKRIPKLFSGHDCRSHKTECIIIYILKMFVNIILNNYVKQKNDVFTRYNMPQQKRGQKK